MKSHLISLSAALSTAINNLPADAPHVFVLDMPRPDAGNNYSSSVADIHNWFYAWENVFPDAKYDNGINRLTFIGNEKPQGVPMTRYYNENDEPQSQEMVVEWQDQGVYDPMIEATATISSLQETKTALETEISRQAAEIAQLQQKIATLNASIDAAQGQ